MPKGVPIEMWKDKEIRKLFKSLVKQSERTVISWAKFRELDKNGKFANLSDITLVGFNRRMKFKAQGMCLACGKMKPEKGKTVCERCGSIARTARKEYYYAQSK